MFDLQSQMLSLTLINTKGRDRVLARRNLPLNGILNSQVEADVILRDETKQIV